MQDEPIRRTRFRRPDQEIYIVLGIGIVIGMLLMTLLGTGLYSFGLLQLGELPTPAPPPVCPATPDLALVCPTCEATPTQITCPPTATPPPPTPTPDLGATATAACATYEAEFPGTPCP